MQDHFFLRAHITYKRGVCGALGSSQVAPRASGMSSPAHFTRRAVRERHTLLLTRAKAEIARSRLTELPDELLVKIATFLTPASVVKLSESARSLRILASRTRSHDRNDRSL